MSPLRVRSYAAAIAVAWCVVVWALSSSTLDGVDPGKSRVLAAPVGTVLRLSTDLGIPADPAVDVTARLNEAIANAGPFTTLVFEGMYRADTSVRIKSKSQLKLSGIVGKPTGLIRLSQSLRPTSWPRSVPFYPHFAVDGSDNIQILNLQVRGPLPQRAYDPLREKAHGVDIGPGSTGILVLGVDIRGVHGDFVYIGGAFLQPRPVNIAIERVTGLVSGRQSLAITSGQFITVRNSDFQQSARSGIDIEPLWGAPPGIVSDLLVEDTRIADCRNFGFGAHNVPTYRVKLRRVQVFGCTGLGKFNALPTAWHDGLVMEDVLYDWRGLTLPPEVLKGAWFSSNVRNVSIVRANWRFRKGEPGMIAGEGTVQDSLFISDAGANPVMCILPGILSINNQGTGACSQP